MEAAVWFRRKKLLIEYDPKELSLELLLALQGSLIAKLRLANRELVRRYQMLTAFETKLPNDKEIRELFERSMRDIQALDVHLEAALARGLQRQGTTEALSKFVGQHQP